MAYPQPQPAQPAPYYRAVPPPYAAYPPPAYASPVVPRVSFWRDVYNGAVYGDFVRYKHFPGALTQVILSFTPGLGSICAVRDCIADLRHRDTLGFLLNLLALVPIFGGFSKVVDVMFSLWHAHHVMRQSRRARKAARREARRLARLPAPPYQYPVQGPPYRR